MTPDKKAAVSLSYREKSKIKPKVNCRNNLYQQRVNKTKTNTTATTTKPRDLYGKSRVKKLATRRIQEVPKQGYNSVQHNINMSKVDKVEKPSTSPVCKTRPYRPKYINKMYDYQKPVNLPKNKSQFAVVVAEKKIPKEEVKKQDKIRKKSPWVKFKKGAL